MDQDVHGPQQVMSDEDEQVQANPEEYKEEQNVVNQESVLMKVASLYASHLLSDITLLVGETKYPAHRVILSASSEVFQCMLMNPQWNESKESVIKIVEDPKVVDSFPLFLKYLYTGQCRINIESAMPLLSLADKYNIKDLTNLCKTYMMKNIALSAHNGVFISWLQYSLTSLSHEALTNELQTFLKLNIEVVGRSKDFVDFDPNSLCVLLQQNDLVVTNELKLFHIVERWLMMKKEQIENEESVSDEEKQKHMKLLIEGICCYIRYPMMTIQEIASIPLRPIASFSKEFFCEKMAIAMSFHANQEISQSDFLQYTPRLYTSDNFCFEMTVTDIQLVENYKSFAANFFSLRDLPYESPSDGK
jgi:hypothetical protein